MMHVITADGFAWIPAATIVGVRRSGAEHAIINLQDGTSIASLEGYESFVERLNDAWLRAAGVEPTWEPQEADALRITGAVPAPSSSREDAVSGIGLDPVFP